MEPGCNIPSVRARARYEVSDRSLDDIRFVLNPIFSPEAVAALDASRQWSRSLDGTDYLPGVIGLNNLKATDYVNVVLTALMRVKPIRDFFLQRSNWASCQNLVARAPNWAPLRRAAEPARAAS